VTVTAGVDGVIFGTAMPMPSALIQPLTDWVTVYVPAADTVIDDDVSPVLHNNDPVKSDAVNSELSQLFETVTAGEAGIVFGAAATLEGELLQPFTDWVTA
jgi:hypothetical protein